LGVRARDEAYGNRGRILTPYGGRGLTRTEYTFNSFFSCRITVEQTFGIIVSRFEVLWAALRCSVMKSTFTIIVCCKLHNFIRDSENHQWATDILSDDPDKHVPGRPVASLQYELHKDAEGVRCRHID
jgi:DDE superfamily endonuclease